jgi:hypothetical protein
LHLPRRGGGDSLAHLGLAVAVQCRNTRDLEEAIQGLVQGNDEWRQEGAKAISRCNRCRQSGAPHLPRDCERLEAHADVEPGLKALAKWDPVVEGVGLVKPGDLKMSLIVSDGAKEQDAVLWFIDAFGYWERLFTTEKLFGSQGRLPDKIIRMQQQDRSGHA